MKEVLFTKSLLKNSRYDIPDYRKNDKIEAYSKNIYEYADAKHELLKNTISNLNEV